MKKIPVVLALAGALSLSLLLTGCGQKAESTDLTSQVTGSGAAPLYASPSEVPASDAAAMTGFGLDLLRQCAGEENVLFSPASLLSALGMTANGARGETLAQMEAVFGLTAEELNQALSAALPKDDKALTAANALWVNETEGIHIEDSFLEANADWYGAGIFSAPFDGNTCGEINQWVSDHTRGMIPRILDRVPGDAVMYLVNALAFDGKWEVPYVSYATMEGTFTREDGSAETADFMHSDEYSYLEGENVTGFLKRYRDTTCAFAALLPNEGVTVAEVLDSLTGEDLVSLLADVRSEEVITALPRLTVDWAGSLEEILPALGMTDAFDPALADLTGLGTSDRGNLYISRVLHKTHMAVDEEGTQAAAATAVEAVEETAILETEPPKEVILDRPFLCLIVDTETSMPVFMGTVMTTEAE